MQHARIHRPRVPVLAPVPAPLRGVALALLIVFAARSPVVGADDARAVELPLVGGKTVKGVVESADAQEVVLRVGPEERRRLPWTGLAPRGVFRVRAALAPPADGAARLALAELAADLGLFVEARAEYEKALALGALDAGLCAQRIAAAERAALAQGVAQARRLADAGEMPAALEVARGLKLAFGEAPNAAEVGRLIEDLLEQIRAQDQAAEQDAADLARKESETRRLKELVERRARAEERLSVGEDAARRCAEAREKGNVTKARTFAEAADGAYVEARKHLGRLRRILPPEDAAGREAVAARLNELDRKQFALLLAMAKFYAAPGARNYARAELWAAKAAYIDPVHPELLELRQRLADLRIRYRFSDVTNARPIVK